MDFQSVPPSPCGPFFEAVPKRALLDRWPIGGGTPRRSSFAAYYKLIGSVQALMVPLPITIASIGLARKVANAVKSSTKTLSLRGEIPHKNM